MRREVLNLIRIAFVFNFLATEWSDNFSKFFNFKN